MTASRLPPIAIIADAHLHDLYGDYDFDGIALETGRMTARSLADTVQSTRVFNESYDAFRHALNDIAARGIKLVVLVGDYSDDGQVSTVAAVKNLLAEYTQSHGIRFISTVGNHDIYGPNGRHQSKRLLNADGSSTLVTSDPNAVDPESEAIIVTEKMFCQGYPVGLEAVADAGFFKRETYLHWETPFGSDDAPAARQYEVRSADGETVRTLMDASYLVEPEEGLWLLMIDANVFEPRNGDLPVAEETSFIDSTSAGWNAMLRHKRFVLDWAKGVSERAEQLGKTLLVFSHYPILDPLDGTLDDELAILGRTSFAVRTPDPKVGAAAAQAGIKVHFSGHLHVNDTALYREASSFVVNVGVSSLSAFPPAFKIVECGDDRLDIETVGISGMKLNTDLVNAYRVEAARTGQSFDMLLDAPDYGSFLFEHINQMVLIRYLPREWPQDLAAIVPHLTLGDLLALTVLAEPLAAEKAVEVLQGARDDGDIRSKLDALTPRYGCTLAAFEAVSVVTMLGDWYRLRKGSELAIDWISPERLAIYCCLIASFADAPPADNQSLQGRFAGLIRMLGRYLNGLPSRNFSIDLATGEISARG